MYSSTPRPWAVMFLMAHLLIVAFAIQSAADYYVHHLPGIPKDAPPIKMHAGHIEIERGHNGNMFFWHFQNRHIVGRQRTVIWLNGGPGCSSEDGALMEVGPYRLKDEETLTFNNGSWNEFANLLFVDNPVGTGFSNVDADSYTRSLPAMASQFVTFLENFFAIFPHYEQDDIYLAGESYAGQYIPYIAKAILQRNEAIGKHSSSDRWNLRGLIIGNGWISPKEQYEAYLTFTVEKGLVQEGTEEGDKLRSLVRDCQQAMGDSPTLAEYPDCGKVRAMMRDIGRAGADDQTCYNIYDVRLREPYPACGMNWPPDLRYATPYLRRPDVVSQLNMHGHHPAWQECTSSVGQALRPSADEPSVRLLPELLAAQLPILLFSGAEDLSCNHAGTEALIDALEWNGGRGFGEGAQRRAWTFGGERAGFWQEARGLTYVLFHDASHMVPLDHPQRSLDMLSRFVGVDAGRGAGDSHVEGADVAEASTLHYPYPAQLRAKPAAGTCVACREVGQAVIVFGSVVMAVCVYFLWRWHRGRAGRKQRRDSRDEEW
ncbi:Peptidase S10, serine carboxypeptidase [Cordyceps fumosorosea ARSEF 2679]|uniref:Carboxypeptidase n=1 Tax=Cordyceps fumosorosea (strain ARSEF 2679) TaxID=1081104 RepID=A0A168DDJ9_CORFA|nr:Peptidase S10, serine carboxypeptidase [Cordyceps fumosorosea ARSEF 2679]OAA72477.1 Peptidase S10, serine carboxypeptidase [Cordyceps fumosorosea ARSEF 2679]